MNAELKERIRVIVAYFTGAYFWWMAYMLLTPRPNVRKITFGFDLVLMLLHFGAFFVLAFGVGLSRRKWSTGRWRVALLVWAVVSECLQILTGRFFEFRDIFQNAFGVFVGLEAARWGCAWARRLTTKTERAENNDGALRELSELKK